MIRCEIVDTNTVNVYSNKFSVDTCTDGNELVIEMSRSDAELLLTKLLEALNKIERRP